MTGRYSSPIFCGIVLIVGIALMRGAMAQGSLVLSELPPQFGSDSPSLSVLTMGGSCLAQMDVLDDLPCAASMLALERKPRFFTTVHLKNGYEALTLTNSLLNRPMARSDFESLFIEKNQLNSMGNIKISFVGSHFAAQFAPYQARVQSVVRNSSYPVLGLHAINEKRLSLLWGTTWTKRVLVGAQLKVFQRQFIHQEVELFQAVSHSGALLQPREQSGVALEPSLTWWIPSSWNWRWTLAVEDLGSVNKKYLELPFNPFFKTGLGASVPVGLGRIEWGVDLKMPQERALALNDFTLGTSYRLGALQFMGGVNASELSGGFRFMLRNLELGVSYQTTRWPSGRENDYQQSILTQAGMGF